MLSETIPTRHIPSQFPVHGGGTQNPPKRVVLWRQDTSIPVDEHGGSVAVLRSVIVYAEPEEDSQAAYELLLDSPNSHATDAPRWESLLEALGWFKGGVASIGHTPVSGMAGFPNWIDMLSPSNTGSHRLPRLSASELSERWKVVLSLVDETVHDYSISDLNYGQEAPRPSIEYEFGTSMLPQSIDEIIEAVNSMGEHRIASRLEYLASEDITEEGDTPISLPVCSGFLEFFTELTNDAYLNLTCAKGWLCAEWDFPDGRSVILWFMGLDEARVTVFDSDGNLADINEGQQVRDRRTIMTNLAQSGYFFGGTSTTPAT